MLVEQLVATPEGPPEAEATTDTAWLTHTLGSASFGVDSDRLTGVLSSCSVSPGLEATPAALLAWYSIASDPFGYAVVSNVPVGCSLPGHCVNLDVSGVKSA